MDKLGYSRLIGLLALLSLPVQAQIGNVGSPRLPGQQLPLQSFQMPVVITGPTLPEARYPGTRTTVGMSVKNLKPGSTVGITPILQVGANCAFLAATPLQTVSAVVAANGEAILSIPGMFPYPVDGTNGPCSFKANMNATRSDGSTSVSTVEFTKIQLTAPSVYVVSNTIDWLQKFSFANTSASGDCVGASNGPSGIFRVGLVTTDSGQNIVDLTFKARSGPFGTRCVWKSQPMLLPEGVKLMQIDVETQNSSKCAVNPATLPVRAASFTSTENPVRVAGEVVAANPVGAGYAISGIASMSFTLDCKATAINDHFVTLLIKSLTFTGPPGLTGFP